MVSYSYDGTITGFFSVIFEIFKEKPFEYKIFKDKEYTPILGAEFKRVDTDIIKAERVAKKIKNDFSKTSLYNIRGAFYSEIELCEKQIVEYIKKGLIYGKDIDNHLEESIVMDVHNMAKRCYREAHKIKGLLRFKELKDHSLYAEYESGCNVLPLIFSHFEARFPCEKWAIYDSKRKSAVIYNGKESSYIQEFELNRELTENIDWIISEDEAVYQKLWKGYFKNIAIKERENKRLQMQFMPKKYWKFLKEMEE